MVFTRTFFFQLLVTLWLPGSRWWGHSELHLWLVGFDPKHCYKTSTANLATTYNKTYCFIRSLTSILVFKLHRSGSIRPCRTVNWILITLVCPWCMITPQWAQLNKATTLSKSLTFSQVWSTVLGKDKQDTPSDLVHESIHFYGNQTTKGKSLNAFGLYYDHRKSFLIPR